MILRRSQKRVALLVIKVNPGIRVRDEIEKTATFIEVASAGKGEILAISEMAAKINERKSSLFLSAKIRRTRESRRTTLQPMKRLTSLHEQ